MKNSILKYLILTFVVGQLLSCETVETEVFIKDATLIWQGEYSDNGCGFILVIENQEYKPVNEFYIDPQYKLIGEMAVELEFYLLYEILEYKCGENIIVEEREGIEIINIVKTELKNN